MSGDDDIAPGKKLAAASSLEIISLRKCVITIPARFTVHNRDKNRARFRIVLPAERAVSITLSEKHSRFMFHYYNALTCDQSYVPLLYLITRRGIDKALSAYTGHTDLNGIIDLKEWK